MTFEALIERSAKTPVVESRMLRAWGEKPAGLAVQLSRWARQGKLIPLRRGMYLLPPLYRRVDPPAEYLANLLRAPSYVSLERAMAIRGLIPELVPLVQSVTTGRPRLVRTPVGDFDFRHVKPEWFFGYEESEVPGGRALVATPEKAVLDRLYLSSGAWTDDRISELRLQNLERLSPTRLAALAKGHGERIEANAAALTRWLRRGRRK